VRRVTSPPTIPPPPAPRPHDERQILAMVRWLLILAFVVLGWLVLRYAAVVLAPVLAALFIAYLLSPVIDKLVARGVPRSVAALGILILFLGTLIALITAFAPMVARQVDHFVRDFPRMIENLSHWLESTFGIEVPDDWKAYLKSDALSGMSDAAGPMRDVATAALGGVLSVLGVLAEALLVPVFAFYFLVDWKNITRRVIRIIPPRRRSKIIDLLAEIDGVVSGWVRGQATVTAILAVLYAISFSIVGMPLAIPIGLLVGVLTVIPFVGTIVGALIAVGVTLADGAPLHDVAVVGGIIGVLHLLEAAVLTPKIVGHRVGLSESAALFAVVAGGKLLGFVGILLAVPIAATVAVLIRQLMRVYEHSEFFGKEADAIVPVTAGMAAVMIDTGPASALSPPGPDPVGLGPSGAPDHQFPLEPELPKRDPDPDPEDKP
jgi:predicted PurR-regulated permease PerM